MSHYFGVAGGAAGAVVAGGVAPVAAALRLLTSSLDA